MSTNRPEAAMFGEHPSTYGCEVVEGVNWGRIEKRVTRKVRKYRLVDGKWIEVVETKEEPRS